MLNILDLLFIYLLFPESFTRLTTWRTGRLGKKVSASFFVNVLTLGCYGNNCGSTHQNKKKMYLNACKQKVKGCHQLNHTLKAHLNKRQPSSCPGCSTAGSCLDEILNKSAEKRDLVAWPTINNLPPMRLFMLLSRGHLATWVLLTIKLGSTSAIL